VLTWIVENPVAVWLIAAIILGVIEMLSLDFFCLMLSFGCLAAMLTALAVDSWTVQVIVFAVVAILLLFLVRPIMLRRLRRNSPHAPTNVDRLIGQHVEVLEAVSDKTGLIRLEGDHWTARTVGDSAPIPTGHEAVVQRIEGATAIVSNEAPETEQDSTTL